MHMLLLLEILFILFNLFFLLKNFLKRINIKKEGTYTTVRNFNASFFTTGLVCLVFIAYIFIYSKDFTDLTKYLAILLLILLIISSFLNANILFGHDSFIYMFSNRTYKDIKKVTILNRGTGKLVTFLFKNGSKLSITTSKNSGSIILEILKRKSIYVEHAR